MQRIQFYAGEDRHVRIKIHATNGEPFIIRSASWELRCSGQVESEGECLIEEHVIDAKISPTRRTAYQLFIKYLVADEIRIECIEVEVK